VADIPCLEGELVQLTRLGRACVRLEGNLLTGNGAPYEALESGTPITIG
jgi:hypothetical protein